MRRGVFISHNKVCFHPCSFVVKIIHIINLTVFGDLMNENFQKSLEKYADIIVNIGLGLRKEQRLTITAGLPEAKLVRLIAKKPINLASHMWMCAGTTKN